jgi:hypothetical protein
MSKESFRVRAVEKPRGDPPKTFPEGRHCEECGTRLSIYNPADICNPCKEKQHKGGRPPLTGGQAQKLRG